MENQKKKFLRTAELIAILSKYGFNELLIQTKLKKNSPPDGDKDVKEGLSSFSVYERIRMVLEDLGPTYIKLGQTFSNREDLLPAELIVELKKLQDNVAPMDLDIYAILKQELEIDPEQYFLEISKTPLATASISQVYRAVLSDKRAVILKIKRPGIKEKTTSDLLIIKDLAKLLVASSETFRKLNLTHVVASFEKSIYEEMSFLNEINNMDQFAQNFKDNPKVQAVLPHRELSNDQILCMDYIEGTKVTDKPKLIEQGLDLTTIAQSGLDVYLTQVLEHGFFHADPHPGNLFVMPNGALAFIDFGCMGKMIPKDKEHLEDFIINFIAKDAKRLIKTLKKMALEIKLDDEQKLERQIHELFDILDNDSLENIDLKDILKKFTTILNNNEILMPDYTYLLVRGIVLIEGIGRDLDPSMNLIQSVKPYIKKIFLRRWSPEQLLHKSTKTLRNIGDGLGELPENLSSLLQKINEGKIVINQQNKDLNSSNKAIATALNRLAFTVLIAGFCIATGLLVIANKPPYMWGIPTLGLLGILVSSILSVIVLLSIFKKNK
ncbi:AarF/ABC1/UbiB kinase family protein [Flavobacterium sp. NKUCC04_CG]|uniref:ABC1 kinase family protein n=1 Tax=Flavobacterium sp. NKUCC04_CG TaxID=2842121 RepID=UPI001C5AABD0|nr:AarF/UbiB family protein [Flavobacterium sp. NKUCC04_CG]MBW3517870.1 AarF/ABC1/UbiB kinase family protein [Flavobacterium sp. NKUCC04_CG]